MKVILAKSAGFCWGVKRAVDKARELVLEARKNNHAAIIHTDGPLIHNGQMIRQMQEEGIFQTEKPEALSCGTLLIRAHGIPPDRRNTLRKLPVTLIDATCPDVARIQGLIKKHAAKRYNIIIFGDKGHAEVVGLLGFADGKGFVVTNIKDIDCLPEMENVCLVSQSTQFPSSYEKIAQAAARKFPNIKILNTICEATKNRQKEIVELAKTADAIVVVGDSHSANTIRLFELAGALKPSFHIQTSSELDIEQLRQFKTIGLTAGASTPDFIINDVKKALEEI